MRKNSRTKPKPQARRYKKNSTPSWAWLVIGILLGLFLSQVNFSDIYQSIEVALEKREVSSKKTPQTSVKPATTTRQKTKFDFYTILPGKNQEYSLSKHRQKVGKNAKKSGVKDTKSAVQAGTKKGASKEFTLQIASVRRYSDADRLKAQLLLLGFQNVSVQKTKKGSVLWHRVIVGSYDSQQQARKAQKRLRNHHMDSIIVKQ